MASAYKFMGTSLKVWGGAMLLLLAYFVFLMSAPVEWVQSIMAGFEQVGDSAPTEPLGEILEVIFVLVFGPAIFATHLLWAVLLGLPSNPFVDAPREGLVPTAILLAWTLGLTWLFWWVLVRTAWSRCLYVLGLWDPFAPRAWDTRRWALKLLVKLRDTAEIATKFGRQPTGGWAGLMEVLSNRYFHGDVFLGRPTVPMVGAMLRPIGLPTEKHMVTIAGTGAGKSTAALIPNLCIHPGSLLCIDPKGELARITARRRGTGGNGVEGMGQAVHVLDPFNVTGFGASSSYNVFDEMAAVASSNVDSPVGYAGQIAAALVRPLSEKEGYWDQAAKTYLRGLILYVFAHEPVERRTLSRLREFVVEGDVEGHRRAVDAGAIKPEDVTPHDVLMVKMKKSRNGPYGEAIAAAAGSIEMMGENQRGGVITTAQEHTVFLDAPEITRVTGRSDFVLEDLKNEAVSVYVCLPAHMVSGKEGRWLRMFVLLFIDMMMRTTKAPKPPILLAIDEFPNLGRLEGIELVAPMFRSYGARFWAIGQDIEQFKKAYPQSWPTFIGSAEAVQIMGIKDPGTVNWTVGLLGKHVVTETTVEQGRTHQRKFERPLLDAEQIRRYLSPERQNQIVWRGNVRPMKLKIAPYYEYLPSWYYDRDDRYPERLRRRIWRPWFRRSNGGRTPPRYAPPPEDSPPVGPPAVDSPRPAPSPAKPAVEARPVAPKQPETRESPAPPAPDAPPADTSVSKKPTEADEPPREPASGELPEKVRDGSQSWSEYLVERRQEADPPRPDVAASDGSSPAMHKLKSMIGLAEVKTKVEELSAVMQHQQRRRRLKLPEVPMSHHLVSPVTREPERRRSQNSSGASTRTWGSSGPVTRWQFSVVTSWEGSLAIRRPRLRR